MSVPTGSQWITRHLRAFIVLTPALSDGDLRYPQPSIVVATSPELMTGSGLAGTNSRPRAARRSTSESSGSSVRSGSSCPSCPTNPGSSRTSTGIHAGRTSPSRPHAMARSSSWMDAVAQDVRLGWQGRSLASTWPERPRRFDSSPVSAVSGSASRSLRLPRRTCPGACACVSISIWRFVEEEERPLFAMRPVYVLVEDRWRWIPRNYRLGKAKGGASRRWWDWTRDAVELLRPRKADLWRRRSVSPLLERGTAQPRKQTINGESLALVAGRGPFHLA